MSTPFLRFRLTFKVCTPLHIGAGQTYLRDYDFRIEPGPQERVRLIDVDRALELLDEREFEQVRDGQVAAKLPARHAAAATREVLPCWGSRRVGQDIHAFIRDGLGNVYVPGSTLKGAFRSALLDAWVARQPLPTVQQAVRGPMRDRPSRERAARLLEQAAFDVEVPNTRPGSDFPNRDANRWLRMSDAPFDSGPGLAAAEVQVRSSGSRGDQAIPLWVEAVTPGSTFRSELTLAPGSFSPWRELDRDRRSLWGDDLLGVLKRWGEALRSIEVDHWRRRDAAVASAFEGALSGSPYDIYVPLGFGTGWTAKTVGRHLMRDRQLMADLLQVYKISRSKAPDPAAFPAGRRVVNTNGGWVPLGWVALTRVDQL